MLERVDRELTRYSKSIPTTFRDHITLYVVELRQSGPSRYLLVWAGLPALEPERDPLLVLLENVVVEDAAHGRGRAGAARLHQQAADVAGHKVVVEEHVLKRRERVNWVCCES